MIITGHEETLRDADLPTRLMQPSEVWGERWNANPNPLARRWMETVVDKQSMVVLAADRYTCLLYTSPSPRDRQKSRMPSSA